MYELFIGFSAVMIMIGVIFIISAVMKKSPLEIVPIMIVSMFAIMAVIGGLIEIGKSVINLCN